MVKEKEKTLNFVCCREISDKTELGNKDRMDIYLLRIMSDFFLSLKGKRDQRKIYLIWKNKIHSQLKFVSLIKYRE